jgi:copper resistance protein B
MKTSIFLCAASSTLRLSAATPVFAEPSSMPMEHRHETASPEPAEASTEGHRTSEAEHVPPEPPQHAMSDMPYREMAAQMQMDDRKTVGKVLFDQLEWRDTSGGNAAVWEAQAWYGGDYNKVWFKSEGERTRGTTQDARAELLWDRIFSRWWSVQAGVREDFGQGPPRTWAAFGVEGLAPYWFAVEATAYVGEQGRTAARVKTDYDLLFTQRLILQPELEANLYGKNDQARGVGAGLSDVQVALRLRYEIRREVAPYVGVAWLRRFGNSADFARAAGDDPSELQWVAGLRVWF